MCVCVCNSVGTTYAILLCQPVSWLAKCHTKRCLELCDIATSHKHLLVWLTGQPGLY